MKPITLAALFLSSAVLVAPAFADSASAAKQRMRERVHQIDSLKTAEAVGENNQGFLEARKSDPAVTAVVEAENADRKVVFAETARNAGTTADTVGRAFARQIAAASAPGVWLQRENGEWYRK